MSIKHWKQVLRKYTEEDFEGIASLAEHLGLDVTVFDFETTGLNVNGHRFGIVEAGFVHVVPSGSIGAAASLVNPENPIESGASAIHGIYQGDVINEKSWCDSWREAFAYMANNHLMVGFNHSYDMRAATSQADRYECRDLVDFPHTLDVRTVCSRRGVKGKLAQVAETVGVPFTGDAHRALDDVLVTCRILNAVILEDGLDGVLDCVKPYVPPSRR